MPELKLFVWTKVLWDYSAGMIVSIAPDLESALAATEPDYVRAEMGKVAPEIIVLVGDVEPKTWHVHGGG